MNIYFGQLVSHVTILAKRVLDSYEIQDLENIVKACFEPNKISETEINSMLDAMKNNRKIDAIRSYRAMTGIGLKEAKDAIEKYWVNKPVNEDKIMGQG